MTIDKIVKYKPCKRVNLDKVKQEIERVRTLAQSSDMGFRKSYNLHNVPVAGEVFLVGDAKYLNRETHQTGRGNLRYLFDKNTHEYNGLAEHNADGNYRRVA
jgi:hypothetical protein